MNGYEVLCPHCKKMVAHGPLLPVLFGLCAYCGREMNGGGGEYWKSKQEADVAETLNRGSGEFWPVARFTNQSKGTYCGRLLQRDPKQDLNGTSPRTGAAAVAE